MDLEKLQLLQDKLKNIPKKKSKILYIKRHLFDEFIDITKSELFFLVGFSEGWYYKNKDILSNPDIRENTDYILQFIEIRLENEIWKDNSYGAKVQLAKLFYNKTEQKTLDIKTEEKSQIDATVLEKIKAASE